ncbi:hypothetical protein [Alkaliphilus hydrothermalis]|uniref:Uncharacterized protein n=1 Tax=Alkaliphilus hydrothermalis TaxID=1482730 RepID=A0ABS2NRD2_9FIRM|nr:hypothetical protein [Alkaliphilus hydrothermalis]MBM7615493.1 hypothetical protein [Alkaliphilus hydrothermalis]
MDTLANDYAIKNLIMTEFEVWNYDDDIDVINELIINAIRSSEGVFVYRRLTHLLEENKFIKWLKNETEIIHCNEVSIEFKEHSTMESFRPINNEGVYFLKFTEDNKEDFLRHFRLSIRAIKNRIGKSNGIKYLEKSMYIDDPLYDQYDFIFTVGDKVILFTDIHDFTFVKAEV